MKLQSPNAQPEGLFEESIDFLIALLYVPPKAEQKVFGGIMTPEETSRCSNKVARESKTLLIKVEFGKSGKIIIKTTEIYAHVCTKSSQQKTA